MEDNNLKFLIMRKNDIITYAEFSPEGNMLKYSKDFENEELGPLQDHYQNNWLKLWWNERSVPIEQDNIKSFLKENGYSMPSEYLIKNLGLSLTDYYWLKPIGSNLTWEDVNLYDNNFKDDILSWENSAERGDSIDRTPHYSPNGSLQGTIEKSWIIKDKERYLLKGNHTNLSTESINEIIAGKIHKLQGYDNYAKYNLIHINNKPYDYGCYSKLFTSQNTELVSAWALFTNEKKRNSASNLDHLLNMCEKFGMDKDTIRIDLEYQILTDFIMSGHDRHLNNIAFLRDADSLKFKGISPIFDSGGSMFAGRSIPKTEKDLFDIRMNGFASREKDLLKLVNNRDLIDLTKLPPVSFIKELYEKDSKMHEKDINNICYWYEKKIDLCRDFQLGRDITRKNHYIIRNDKSKLNFIMLCGIPGSGKTNMSMQLIADFSNKGYKEISPNSLYSIENAYKDTELIIDNNNIISNPKAVSQKAFTYISANNIRDEINDYNNDDLVFYIVDKRITEALNQGISVIYEATNLDKQTRQHYIELSGNVEKKLYLTNADYNQIDVNIPEEKMYQLAYRLYSNIPNEKEGWNSVNEIGDRPQEFINAINDIEQENDIEGIDPADNK